MFYYVCRTLLVMFCFKKQYFSQLLKAHVILRSAILIFFFLMKKCLQQNINILEYWIVWDKGKDTWA